MVMPTMGNGMQAITEPMENLAVCGIRSSSAYPPNTLWATSLIAAATLALLDMTASPFRSRLDVPRRRGVAGGALIVLMCCPVGRAKDALHVCVTATLIARRGATRGVDITNASIFITFINDGDISVYQMG